MKVGVLGAGNIGGTLGKRWAQAGHTVQFGVRDVTDPKAQALVSGLGAQASVATLAEAIAFGDVVVFAIPGGAMEATIRAYGQALNGKIVIDAANRMGAPAMNSAAIFAARFHFFTLSAFSFPPVIDSMSCCVRCGIFFFFFHLRIAASVNPRL